ncbi:Ribosomal RNA-processing protein 8, partial [Trichinella sp. T8]
MGKSKNKYKHLAGLDKGTKLLLQTGVLKERPPGIPFPVRGKKNNSKRNLRKQKAETVDCTEEIPNKASVNSVVLQKKDGKQEFLNAINQKNCDEISMPSSETSTTSLKVERNNNNKLTNYGVKSEDDCLSPMGKQNNSFDSSSQLSNADRSGSCEIQLSVNSKARKQQRKLDLKTRLCSKLQGSYFRWINEMLYTSSSEEVAKLFSEDPHSFAKYHEGYELQVSKWPVNPLDMLVNWFQKKPKTWIVSDMGCGNAKLQSLIKQKVYSFDFVALNPNVIACDMSHVPLSDENVDVCIFSLSLMGSNIADYILESNRILRINGILIIIEILSRFQSLRKFRKAVENFGFEFKQQNLIKNYFIWFKFVKKGGPQKTRAIVYKAPGQLNGKIIESTAVGDWDNGAQALSNPNGHSFATALQHVVVNNNNVKFIAYNNAPPAVPNLKTKSNSKGIIILSDAVNTDSAAWIVHTVPGFPAAKTGYNWPLAENARGHLLICLTISESQINAIAASLLLVQPVIYYNDIPQTETAGMPYFNKLAEGKIPTLPPFTSRQTIQIYKKVIVNVLKKTIKVWSRRDRILKGVCRGSQRHIRLIKSPAVVVDHNTNLEADITNWAVSDPGNIFCHIDKPYFKNQSREPAMAVCIDNINIFTRFDAIAAQLEDYILNKRIIKAIVYKAPAQPNGKIIFANAAGGWENGAVPFINDGGHSFAKAIEDAVGNNRDIKFLAFNNVPPRVPNLKTKSNSKGIIILSIAAATDSAAWIVHTVPGFPAAKTVYNWPLAENARGHLLICLTISESQLNAIVHKTIVYKAPGQPNGKIILATAAVSWNDGAQALSSDNGHSFATALQHVVRDNGNIKFLAYNNAPPGVANVKTKSNSKGVIILATNADSAAWIVHTVPGFPAAKTGYNWPVAENARGHLLICLTISESQINAIAASLLLVQPLIHYNDIPKTETVGMPYFNKLADGKIPTLPPFTSRQTIRTQSPGTPITVHIYSKSESSKYEIYKKVIVKVLKKTIKVWSRRDSKLKGDCRGSQRHIRLIKSPAAINGHNTNLEADITNWAVSDPGNIFCHIDKPYIKNQTREPAMAICIDNNDIFARFNEIAAQSWRAILYKAPGQATGKIIEATAAAGDWQDGARALSNPNQHSFATALQHVVGDHQNAKFLAYNNAPPGVPSIKTKSNSKGVIILATNADSAAWVVHTVPGFPAAKTGYNWPLAENARGHLLICLTISESQINAIAASLLLVQPVIYYNDIPQTETAGMPYFNKLADGKISTLPPFTSRQTIRTQNANPVTVHIYSKSESSKYEIYKKVIVKVLKKTIKVWSRRDRILKGVCRGSQRHIRLIKIYKAPGQDTGKIIFATAARSWDNGAIAFTNNAGHSFAKTLEDVVRDHINIKFLAYNNAPPGVPNVNTKSNSKGLIILSTAADSAAWIVHTVPGFPTARTPYSWPAAENARGHLLICLTISESQINAIAASLLLVQPMVHYNDIPETETAGMPYFKKLAEGKVPTLPPFTSRRSIRTENAGGPVAVHIYSKSESSKYEIYKKVIVKVLKKTIKVWSRRDNILKGDCRGSQRHIRLIKSPAAINGHNTNLEADITNWAVSDPGNIFCHIDKPYFKNQTREPAMAVCIDNNEIFARFNECAFAKLCNPLSEYCLFLTIP